MKQNQRCWSKRQGENYCVAMFGGFRIKMAAFKTLGHLNAFVPVIVTTSGTTDSFLKAFEVTPTGSSHQIIAKSLFLIMHKAYYTMYTTSLGDGQNEVLLEDRCINEGKASPHSCFSLYSCKRSL